MTHLAAGELLQRSALSAHRDEAGMRVNAARGAERRRRPDVSHLVDTEAGCSESDGKQ